LDNNIFNTSLYGGINDYVAAAHELAASDLHFVPDADRVNVFTRTNGDMRFQGAINHSEYDRLLNAFKFSSGLDVANSRVSQDARLSMPTRDGTLFLARLYLTYSSRRILNIEVTKPRASMVPLSIWAWILSRLIRSRKRSSMVRELFLITGLTGSGKTSTYYTTLRFLQNDGMKIISLEDPVEQFLDGVVQVEVGEEVGLDTKNNSIGAKE